MWGEQKETKETKMSSRPKRKGISSGASVSFASFCSRFLAVMFGLLLLPAAAATDDLTSLLQKGLFEEEANRNLSAAITNYESLAKQFEQNRQIAATAVFRLGECYRKLGQTNEAAVQYQRILRDFSDQPTLVTLSRQNLAGMGASIRTGSARETEKSLNSPEEQELLRTENILAQLDGWDFPRMRRLIPQLVPDAEFERINRQLELNENFGTSASDSTLQQRDRLRQELSKRAEQLLVQLKVRVEKLKQSLADKSGITESTEAAVVDDEEKELRRIKAMVQNSPDLINSPGGSDSPLFSAAIRGWLRVAAYLIDHGANIDLNTQGTPALIGAAGNGRKTMVELLLKRGGNVNVQSSGGETALHVASGSGFLSVAEVLLDHNANPNAKDNRGITPVHRAAMAANVESLKLLLARGGDPNAKGRSGETPMLSALINKKIGSIAVLVAAKADPNISDNSGVTPLSVATEIKNRGVVEQLIAAGAKPDAGDLNPPLFWAIKYADTNLAEVLLEAGANPNKRSKIDGGVTGNKNSVNSCLPLELALSPMPPDKTEIVKLLLRFKANPNASNSAGQPLIFYGLFDSENLRSLLEAGANPNAVETILGLADKGETPLMVAARSSFQRSVNDSSYSRSGDGDRIAAKLLIDHGAKVNVSRPSDGMTPLHLAAQSGSPEIVELLLTNKAEVNVRDKAGQTPLDLAKYKASSTAQTTDGPSRETFEQIITLLREHGALDNLPDFSVIRLTRQGLDKPIPVFEQNTNGWNQFTLMETLARFYDEYRNRPSAGLIISERLPFPDLTRIIIHRPDRTTEGKVQTIQVNLLNSTNGIGCEKNVVLEFGDVVEIPIREYRLTEMVIGLTVTQANQMYECIKRQITVKVRDQVKTLSDLGSQSFVSEIINRPEVQSLLLSSSDLSRVKVIRQNGAGGRKQEWTIDCDADKSNTRVYSRRPPPGIPASSFSRAGDSESDLWLRDGDVIEIPEK